MSEIPARKAPWTHRLAIWFFSILLGLLVFWLTGYLRQDIRTWPGPDYQTMEDRMLDPDLRVRRDTLNEQLEQAQRTISEQQQRQGVLRDSTASTRETMNQLLEFQRINIEKGTELSDEERTALGESQKLFLANQSEYQQLNTSIAEQTARLQDLERQNRALAEALEKATIPIQKAHRDAWQRHNWYMAAIELTVLIPFAIVALLLFFKARRSIYTPIIYAFDLAVLTRIGLVIHEYFPSRYFKYILILLSIVIVVWILIYLLRLIAFPKKDWLLKQHREAYQRFECPVCNYPIRRGPMRFVYWTRRTLTRLGQLEDADSTGDEPYVCPSCGTQLFEECDKCHRVRHSLLPACDHCGDQREVVTPRATAAEKKIV